MRPRALLSFDAMGSALGGSEIGSALKIGGDRFRMKAGANYNSKTGDVGYNVSAEVVLW